MYSDVGNGSDNDDNVTENEEEPARELDSQKTDNISDDVVSEVRKEPYRIHCNPNH